MQILVVKLSRKNSYNWTTRGCDVLAHTSKKQHRNVQSTAQQRYRIILKNSGKDYDFSLFPIVLLSDKNQRGLFQLTELKINYHEVMDDFIQSYPGKHHFVVLLQILGTIENVIINKTLTVIQLNVYYQSVFVSKSLNLF